jgi:hypothetical protein
MRKCNDEVYQLAKDQALVKKLNKQKISAFLFMSSGFVNATPLRLLVQ